ncbi:Cna B-type domain-containing protein [uncultured Eubacterium sp.]|uniref:Cna B-type domain-containing protein n=1 Tax=uncultured Eubacterium sp. TaxID=165185 RepID=UPI0025912D63|nr:Cna B-type domain-containing protein [uncultured Eubacterium sp.]
MNISDHLRKIITILLAIIVLAVLFVLVPRNIVHAQGDISNDVVTNLQVTPAAIQDGGNVTVQMDFAENERRNIQGGDTISITWTRQADIQFSGYKKTLPLTVNGGKNVGTAEITESGATLTFNNEVNNLDDVKGYVSFEVQGRNFTDTSEENTKTGTITAGGKSVSVSVTKPEAGTSSVFYYKTGDMRTNDTEHVSWWLNVNCGKAGADGDVTIKDDIQGGQELKNDSFDISVTDSNNQQEDYRSIEDFLKAYDGSAIKINGSHIDVHIPQSWVSNRMFSIYYQTTITDPSQKEFVNNSKVWYREHGKEAVSGEDNNFTVQNINASAGVTGTVKGELKIFKRVQGTEVGIPGVQFVLRNNSKGEVIKDGKTEITLVTGEDGTVSIKGLPVGKYVVKEISAPEWIDFDPDKSPELKFEVKEEDTEGTLLQINNAVKKISIPVVKQWQSFEGEPIGVPENAAVKVELLRNGQSFVPKKEVTLGKDHLSAEFSDLDEYDPHGKKYEYTVKEEGENDGVIQFGNTCYSVTYSGTVKGGLKVINKEKTPRKPTIPETPTVPETPTIPETPASPETRDIQVTKRWKNQDGNAMNAPISEIAVELYRDGHPTGKNLTLNAGNHWSGTFRDLETTKESGSAVDCWYTVKEIGEKSGTIQLDGQQYKVVYEGNMKDGLSITNEKVVPETPSVAEKSKHPKTPSGVQKPKKPSTAGSTTHSKVEKPKAQDAATPKTGDEANPSLYAWIMIASGSLLLLLVMNRRKHLK